MDQARRPSRPAEVPACAGGPGSCHRQARLPGAKPGGVVSGLTALSGGETFFLSQFDTSVLQSSWLEAPSAPAVRALIPLFESMTAAPPALLPDPEGLHGLPWQEHGIG